MLIAVLRIVDRKTHDAANLVRERSQVVSGRSDPYSGFWSSHSPSSYSSTAIELSMDLPTTPATNGLQMAAFLDSAIALVLSSLCLTNAEYRSTRHPSFKGVRKDLGARCCDLLKLL